MMSPPHQCTQKPKAPIDSPSISLYLSHSVFFSAGVSHTCTHALVAPCPGFSRKDGVVKFPGRKSQCRQHWRYLYSQRPILPHEDRSGCVVCAACVACAACAALRRRLLVAKETKWLPIGLVCSVCSVCCMCSVWPPNPEADRVSARRSVCGVQDV